MPKSITTIALLVSLAFIIWGCGEENITGGSADDPVSEGAQLTIANAEFDFGYAPQNAKISHRFWLYSTGGDTLLIDRVVPG